jgi:hypothetical protein
MQQRGRKSAAQLSVVAGTIDGRPEAPPNLSKSQTEIWNRVVACEAADFFRTATVQVLLAEYCRHVERAAWLEDEIAEARKPTSQLPLEDVDRLLKMAERETRAVLSIATKLRLTNQSRYQPSVAATAAKNAGTERKLWQRRNV